MKRMRSKFSICIAALLALSLIFSIPAMAASKITVVGEINDEYQIVGRDGNIYEIADTDMGNQLLNFIGSVVEATGTVQEEEGIKILFVESFKIMGE
ncbi:MAG: hypothetical protein ABII68_08410 [Pseudomonadota bacterium]